MTFQAHIIGVLRNVMGPQRDLILARLEGGPLATTGVIQGMSGSPVFIDGRLVGAVSYQLGTQRRVNGTLSVGTGSFYSGHQTSASYRGRIAVATHLSLEPQVAVNWVDLPQGVFTTKLVSTRATVPLTPRMYVSALLQYNSTNTSFDGFPTLDTRGLVVKINRLLRL